MVPGVAEETANQGIPKPSGGNSRASILKSSLLMSVMTALSRLFGLLREQVQGYFLGTGMGADAFAIGSTIPNLLRRLFAEGQMTAAFVPVLKDEMVFGDRERLTRFYSGFMTLFILLMLAITLLGIAFAEPIVRYIFASKFADVPGKMELTIGLTRLMFPYLMIISVAAIVQATLNAFKIFGPSAFTPVLLSIAIIAAVALFHDSFPNPAWALAIGFVVGGIFQLLFQIPFLRKAGVRFRPTLAGLKDSSVRLVGRQFLPGILGAGVYQINIAVSQIIATTLAPGTVASLHYSLRLQEVVLGIFAVSVSQVILPTMSEQSTLGDRKGLGDTLEFSVRLMALVTIPATAGLIILGDPIIRLLFQYGRFGEESVRMTVWALNFHAAGIFFIALHRNATQVFYAMKDMKTPVIVAVVSMIVNVGLCLALAGPMQNGGIALAGSVASLASAALTLVILHVRGGFFNPGRMFGSLPKVLVATGAMAALLLVLRFYFGFFDVQGYGGLGMFERVRQMGPRVAISIPAAILVFVVAARFLHVREVGEISAMVKRRINRRKAGRDRI